MSDPILKIEGISKSFGGVRALINIDAEIQRGTIHSVIGPNGSGKTTLINVITGFYKPDTGSILFNGENIVAQQPHIVARKGIGRTFQNLRLFDSMSVKGNIKTALSKDLHESLPGALLGLPSVQRQERLAAEKALAAMEKFEIAHVADRKVATLPYGTRRMVEIGRALCLDPQILILDEPVAGMNPSESVQLMRIIRRLVDEEHITIILIEHDMKVVMNFSDQITVINHGEVIACGLPQDIQKHETVIEAYLGHGRAGRASEEEEDAGNGT